MGDAHVDDVIAARHRGRPPFVALEVRGDEREPSRRVDTGIPQHPAHAGFARQRSDRCPYCVSRVQELKDDVAADEAGTTADQYLVHLRP
jgi:hypothetical protein